MTKIIFPGNQIRNMVLSELFKADHKNYRKLSF